MDPRVLEAMLPFFEEDFGNAASLIHAHGRRAAAAVDESRVILYRGFDEMMALAERGEPIPVDRREKRETEALPDLSRGGSVFDESSHPLA